jgi:RNA polymerase sigma factor (sigma-70 family)
VSETNSRTLGPVAYAPGRTTAWNASWRQVYDQFGPAIIAYARRQGLNEHSAEDVLQEVMTTLIRCRCGQGAGYDPKIGPFQAWLWGVIRNRVRSVRRKDEKEDTVSPIPAADAEEGTERALPDVLQTPQDFAARDDEEWQSALLAAAMWRLQQRVTSENFAIYTALLEETATPEELGLKYGKLPNAIYAVKHRCEKILLRGAREAHRNWMQLGHGDAKSPQ